MWPPILRLASSCVCVCVFQEVCAFLGEARSGTVSVTRSGERDLRRGASSLLSGGRNGMKGIGGGVGGVRRDIDRIFESSGGGNGKLYGWRLRSGLWLWRWWYCVRGLVSAKERGVAVWSWHKLAFWFPRTTFHVPYSAFHVPIPFGSACVSKWATATYMRDRQLPFVVA